MATLDYSDVLVGALTTAFGAILVMIWDHYKIYKDTIDRETQILNALKNDIKNNLDIYDVDKNFLKEDIEARKTNKGIVEPLIPLQNEILSLIKINSPYHLLEFTTIIDIGVISINIGQINETIRSRENYRINNEAMSNFSTKMQIYDNLLLDMLDSLVVDLKPLNEALTTQKIIVKADEYGAYYEIKERF